MQLPSLPLSVGGAVLYALAPASMPSGLISAGGTEPLAPRYGLFAAVLAENLGYTVAAMLIACWWFGRREVRIGE